jgi:Fe-S-cluster containining protein
MPTPRRTLLAQDDALAKVIEVYEELERRPVERECLRRTECCQFKLTGQVPYLTEGEALVAARALRAKGIHKLVPREDGACPMLGMDGLCQIYESRPFGCRTHFCVAAGGPYKRREVVDLIRQLEDIDHAVGGCGPRTLPVAVKEALSRSTMKSGVATKAAPRARGR